MLPSGPEVIVVGRNFSGFHAKDFSTNISGSIENGGGAAACAGKQLSVVDRQARHSTPLVVILAGSVAWQSRFPTFGRIESFKGSPLRFAIKPTDLGARNRTAVQLAIVDCQRVDLGAVDADAPDDLPIFAALILGHFSFGPGARMQLALVDQH